MHTLLAGFHNKRGKMSIFFTFFLWIMGQFQVHRGCKVFIFFKTVFRLSSVIARPLHQFNAFHRYITIAATIQNKTPLKTLFDKFTLGFRVNL
jgi:hypothetical protein